MEKITEYPYSFELDDYSVELHLHLFRKVMKSDGHEEKMVAFFRYDVGGWLARLVVWGWLVE